MKPLSFGRAVAILLALAFSTLHATQNPTKSCETTQCNTSAASPFLKNIAYAIKHLDISKEDRADVKLAIRIYKQTCQKTRGTVALKSLENAAFDKELFIKAHPMHERIKAQAELIESLYLIFNDEQKKRFVMLMGASQHYNALHPNAGNQNRACDTTKKACAKGSCASKN